MEYEYPKFTTDQARDYLLKTCYPEDHINKEVIYLGTFSTDTEASEAYLKELIKNN